MSQLLWSCNEDTFSVDMLTRQLDVWGGGGGGKAVTQWTLVWGIFGQKQSDAFS